MIEEARAALASARSVVVLTGAGISVESGIPPFRGAGGLWRNFKPEELATPYAFERDPRTVWEWYLWRREKIGAARPNPGHLALVELERRVPETLLVTQNVDGLHTLAGSRNLVELHGNLWRTRCTSCGEVVENRRLSSDDLPPRCICSGMLRPDVVWFGEPLPAEALERASQASMTCDVMLVVGTSSVVYPAAALGPLAARRGIPVFEVNVEATDLSPSVTHLQGRAGEILPKII